MRQTPRHLRVYGSLPHSGESRNQCFSRTLDSGAQNGKYTGRTIDLRESQSQPRSDLMRIKLFAAVLLSTAGFGQTLPLAGTSLPPAIGPRRWKSAHTCILPIGILENTARMAAGVGPHPRSRMGCEPPKRSTPSFFLITSMVSYEARHQPGTFALPSRLVWDLLDTTCEVPASATNPHHQRARRESATDSVLYPVAIGAPPGLCSLFLRSSR
jgi:hypothetical protein